MNKTILLLIFLCLINSTYLFSQEQIRKVSNTGISQDVNIDSLITIPPDDYDSIVLSKLSVPQNIQCISKYFGCRGRVYCSYTIYNDDLTETKLLRGVEQKYDSIILQQHKIIFNTFKQYSTFEKDNYYVIIIGVGFEYIDSVDNKIVIKNYRLGGRNFILQKSYIDIRFKTETIPFNLIPKNIDECINQLDSVLTDETKNNIKTWSKECYDFNDRHEFLNWIHKNWKIPCCSSCLYYKEWEKVGLEKYFFDLGITNSCNIAGFIFNCYHRHLMGETINFNEEINNNQ